MPDPVALLHVPALSDAAEYAYAASSQQADLATAGEVVRDFFGDHEPPSTLPGVTVLGHPDQFVEVAAARTGA
ncbi:hypothetical protein [Micromonospora vinacea]|uniref:hypothetical protein n=1 Tax=Micromonospora vinacea TaxID=709878 RepID=UPI003F558F97